MISSIRERARAVIAAASALEGLLADVEAGERQPLSDLQAARLLLDLDKCEHRLAALLQATEGDLDAGAAR
jgi:hypothetical protein